MVNVINRPVESFAQVPNALFRNPDLKSRAVHVLGNLLTHNSGIDISVAFIATQTGLSKNTVCAALDDLVTAGYARRIPIAGKHGQFARNDYEVDCDKIVADGKRAEANRKKKPSSNPSQNLGTVETPSQNLGQATVANIGTGPSQNLGPIEEHLLEDQGGEDQAQNQAAHTGTAAGDTAADAPQTKQDEAAGVAATPPAEHAGTAAIIQDATASENERQAQASMDAAVDASLATIAVDDSERLEEPNPRHCKKHAYIADPPKCRGCERARLAIEAAEKEAAKQARLERERIRNQAAACPTCDHNGRRPSINPNTGLETEVVCNHTPHDAQDAAAANARRAHTTTIAQPAENLDGAAGAAAAFLAKLRTTTTAAA